MEDKTKVINDLVLAIVMPLPLVDSRNHEIVIFLDEIANENHTYLFNRELSTFLRTNSDIDFLKEKIDTEVARVKAALLPKNVSKRQLADQKFEVVLQSGQACMSPIVLITSFGRNLECFEKFYKTVGSVVRCERLVESIARSDKDYPMDDLELVWAGRYQAESRVKCYDYYQSKN